MDECFCPSCGAILNNQYGFDPDNGSWTCTECGQTLYGDDVYDGDIYPGTMWYCDECGALLNKQSGFADYYNTWACTECWHTNNLSEDEIYESKEDYLRHKNESGLNADNDDDDDDDDDDDNDDDDDDDDDEWDEGDDNDDGNGSAGSQYNWKSAGSNSITYKPPLKQRCIGILLDVIMIAVGITLSVVAFGIIASAGFGWAMFSLSTGIILLLGGRSFRKAAYKNDGIGFVKEFKGILANIAMRIGGVFLIFNGFDLFNGSSGILLRIGMGIALVIGGHFLQKEIAQE